MVYTALATGLLVYPAATAIAFTVVVLAMFNGAL